MDASQLRLDFESASSDAAREFYFRILEQVENPQKNNSGTKNLPEILCDELPKEQEKLKPLIDAYVAHDPLTVNIINRLIPQMLEMWRFEAHEYSKIFYYPFPSKEEVQLLESIGKIILGKDITYSVSSEIKLPSTLQFMKDVGLAREKDVHSSGSFDKRLPDILKRLIQDEYISKEEVMPEIPEKISPYEEHIISKHYHRHFDMFREFRTSPSIFKRIEDKFSKPENDAESGKNYGLMKVRKVENLQSQTIDELVEMVKDHSSNVFSADIPLSGYSAVLRLSPQEFLDSHALKLLMMLKMDFGKSYSPEFLATKGETFVKGSALGSLEVKVSLHEKYALMSFNRNFTWGGYSGDEGFKVYGVKLLLENYFAQNGISYYGEVNIFNDDKIFYMEKYKSAQFAKENMDRIRSLLDDETVLKIVDYSNHHWGFDAEVERIRPCSCENLYFDGIFKYDKSGFSTDKDDPSLENIKVEFPLLNLHILKTHTEAYNPKIHELESIDQLIMMTKDWTPMKIDAEIEEDYTKIIVLYEDVKKAAQEEWDFWDQTHGGIIEISGKIVDSMKDQINKVYTYMERKYGQLGGHHAKSVDEAISREEKFRSESEILNSKLHFITSTYNTLKMQCALEPQEYMVRIISAVNEQKQLNETAEKAINEYYRYRDELSDK